MRVCYKSMWLSSRQACSHQLFSLNAFCWLQHAMIWVSLTHNSLYFSRVTTWDRTCWPCRWSVSWTRSGSKRVWTWGWLSSTVSPRVVEEVEMGLGREREKKRERERKKDRNRKLEIDNSNKYPRNVFMHVFFCLTGAFTESVRPTCF